MTEMKSWARRPGDEQFTQLSELSTHLKDRHLRSEFEIVSAVDLSIIDKGYMSVATPSKKWGMGLNNWSFTQLCQWADVPAFYLRKLPVDIAAFNLEYGLKNLSNNATLNLMSTDDSVRAVTSGTYGRVWDHQVVEMVEEVLDENPTARWVVPSEASFTSGHNPTTLYAGDRDMWVFLVKDNDPISIWNPNREEYETLYHGSIIRNSEVGKAKIEFLDFLYRSICSNRMIYMTDGSTKKFGIRHTISAPERFELEGKQILTQFLTTPSTVYKETLEKAMTTKVGETEDEVKDWMKAKLQITKKQAGRIIDRAIAEEGDYRTPWVLTQGGTSLAKMQENTDTRVELERNMSRMLLAA